jgi:WhiB family redox-sensing transcriptional regulator
MTATATATRRVTTLAAPDKDWRARAACQYVDPDLHFPESTKSGSRKHFDEAKRVCAACPVKQACLEWALATGQTAGVWGGKSPRERKGMGRPRATYLDKCLSQQAWIEKQIARGVSQNAIARQLGVNKTAMSQAVRQFNVEREQAAAAQGVTV